MKKLKIFFVIALILMLIISITNITYASEWLSDPRENPESFSPGSDGVSGATKVQDIGNRIIGIFQLIGTLASVIVLIVIGIKYMAGSIEERAEYKKTMMPYVIGALLVFGITNILGIVSNITDGLL